MKNRALSSFSHPQEDARAEGLDTKRCWIPMDPHRRATQTRLLRLAREVKCRRQMSPCRRQQLRREALPPCALLHRVDDVFSVLSARKRESKPAQISTSVRRVVGDPRPCRDLQGPCKVSERRHDGLDQQVSRSQRARA